MGLTKICPVRKWGKKTNKGTKKGKKIYKT